MTFHTRPQLEKKLPAFKAWLSERGAEVLQPTSEWEVVRFRAAGATAVVYANKHGMLSVSGDAARALNCFASNGKWSAGVATERQRNRRPVIVRALLERDGDRCFLCRKALADDMTVEHLVPVVHGGPNHISNMALAHSACNLRMGHMSLVEKIVQREKSKP